MVIDHGKLIAAGTLQDLYRRLPASNLLAIELEHADRSLALDELGALPEVRSVARNNGVLRVGVSDLARETPAVLAWLGAHGHSWRHLETERANLETVFLTLTGRSLRDS